MSEENPYFDLLPFVFQLLPPWPLPQLLFYKKQTNTHTRKQKTNQQSDRQSTTFDILKFSLTVRLRGHKQKK